MPAILENPFREGEREVLLSVLDLDKGFMGLNLYLKSHEGCVMKALALGFDGKERSPFDCKTACISATPFSPRISTRVFDKESLERFDFYRLSKEEQLREGEEDETKIRWNGG